MNQSSISYAIEGDEPITAILRPGVTTLGVSSDNDVVMLSPGIADYHARFIVTNDDCWIMSLDEDHGTYLNQVRLRPNARYPLRNGDVLRIGAFFVRYDRSGEPVDELQRLISNVGAPGATAARQPTSLPPEVVSRILQPGPDARRGVGRLPARRLRGNQPPPRGLGWFSGETSSYLQHLPPPYQGDHFMGRFLLIFESILGPIEDMVDHIHSYFDPRLAPESLLAWLGLWVDLALNENWPIEKRRALVATATELYRWRGTRRGMKESIRLYTDVTPQIIERSCAEPGQSDPSLPDHVFRVILEVPDPAAIDRRLVEAIIQAEKPAHTAYILEIRAAKAG